MRKTKIVCTLGPSTDNEEVLRQLMQEGMAVARMNFSHGTHEEQKVRLDAVKKMRRNWGFRWQRFWIRKGRRFVSEKWKAESWN